MTTKLSFSPFVFLVLFLAACTFTQTPTAVPPADSSNDAATPPIAPSGELTRTDAQGEVEFVVEPLNLNAPDDALAFTVTMDTHSVDLSWDLAAQSVLATDTGLEVSGLSWSGGGGHHVEGTLVFPAKTTEDRPLLTGTKTLTLTIRDAGVDERIFAWEILP